MADLVVENENLVIHLSTWEKMCSMRGDVVVPLSSVVSVKTVDSMKRQVRGLRAPGYALGGRKVGTYRGLHTKDFVAMDSYGPGALIELENAGFDRILVSAPLPVELQWMV